ncbi:MAG: hypothetical protein COA82_06310 [Alkaliphilus sp.]|nr:MAG: hypothetical protein COA82_06310 [Alkaliphilus sp.]
MSNTLFIIIMYFAFLILFATIASLFILVAKVIFGFANRTHIANKNHWVLFLLSVVLLSLYYYNIYCNIEFLPKGYLNQMVSSPNGELQISTYNYSGFHLGLHFRAARAAVYNVDTGESKTIYFNNYDYDPYVEWMNNSKVIIGRETLDVDRDIYDFRRELKRHTKLPRQREHTCNLN